MEWVRGEIIGRGSFSTINLATPRRNYAGIPSLMAVKSTALSGSSMLQKERQLLSQFKGCPRILRCFGEDVTSENGEEVYSVFLELACGGSLAQLAKQCGGSMKECDVRHCTQSVLQGLYFGYVHCDIKPQNILVCGQMYLKIADFGLAKKAGEKKDSGNGMMGLIIGTPLYMSPESIERDEYEAPADVWALGCIVVEMITGKPAWRYQLGTDVSYLLFRIGFSKELPEIPEELCEEGKDFLRRCFVRDPTKRWTAEMLLNHPFITEDTVSLPELDPTSPSPRSPFNFPDWEPEHKMSFSSAFDGTSHHSFSSFVPPCHRIQMLAFDKQPNWCCSEDWITIREA